MKQKSWDQNFAEFDCKIVVPLQAKALYKIAKYWSVFFVWIGKANG